MQISAAALGTRLAREGLYFLLLLMLYCTTKFHVFYLLNSRWFQRNFSFAIAGKRKHLNMDSRFLRA